MTEALVKLNANVVGIDPNEKLLNVAIEHSKSLTRQPDYRLETIEEHVSGNKNKYDAVVFSEVLEHIVDKRSFLKSCSEAIKVRDKIFIDCKTVNVTHLAGWFHFPYNSK